MPILSKLPLNYECWPEGRWDLSRFFYIHVAFSGPSATCGQEYYDFVGSNGVDGDPCWKRGVVGGGTECQLRYETNRRCEYEAARSLVHQWPPAGRSLLCEMKVSCITRLGDEEDGSEAGGGGEGGAPEGEGGAAPETGGWISVSWSACMSDSTRMQRYQLFLDIIPEEYAKDWRHDLTRRDGGILSRYSTVDDDAYLGMSKAIEAAMEETNYLFSEMKTLPSDSVVSALAEHEGTDTDDELQQGSGRKKQAYLTKKKGRKRDKRWDKEREERKKHREELKQDYERRLKEDPEFAAREERRKEEKRAKDREKRRKKKEKKERAEMTGFMFGKIFGPERWDEKMAEFQQKGLGDFMPVGDGMLATYVDGRGLERVDREYLYRKEEKDEDHPDAREGKVPKYEEAPLYDEYDEWYNSLPIHRDFLAGTDGSRNSKESDSEAKQRYYPFIELCPPSIDQDERHREENEQVFEEGVGSGKGEDGDNSDEASHASDLFGECVELFQRAYGEGSEEGGCEGDKREEREGCVCGGGSNSSDEDDEEYDELPTRRGTARTNKRVIDSDSEGDD